MITVPGSKKVGMLAGDGGAGEELELGSDGHDLLVEAVVLIKQPVNFCREHRSDSACEVRTSICDLELHVRLDVLQSEVMIVLHGDESSFNCPFEISLLTLQFHGTCDGSLDEEVDSRRSKHDCN